MTATEMVPAIGTDVQVRFEDLRINCRVVDVKHVYGRPRLLVAPVDGAGEQWVELSRIVRAGLPSADVRMTERLSLPGAGSVAGW